MSHMQAMQPRNRPWYRSGSCYDRTNEIPSHGRHPRQARHFHAVSRGQSSLAAFPWLLQARLADAAKLSASHSPRSPRRRRYGRVASWTISSVVMGDPASSETCGAAAVLRVAHDAICAAVQLRRLRRVVPASKDPTRAGRTRLTTSGNASPTDPGSSTPSSRTASGNTGFVSRAKQWPSLRVGILVAVGHDIVSIRDAALYGLRRRPRKARHRFPVVDR